MKMKMIKGQDKWRKNDEIDFWPWPPPPPQRSTTVPLLPRYISDFEKSKSNAKNAKMRK